ncbi:AI-2E family transporter [Nocardioides sp. WL0053]|uniref:AI-2E family transporter n=1 Tax=Nocardioides jiangsuensis TaxID=2866161 RepID=A0ABS7RKE2_9ACTN|nr:AI-2E family transporter [Nocardioides jiangsuensis]MBY9075529.1 AI-2E family transporter [Nocardioides jiangsuensis]
MAGALTSSEDDAAAGRRGRSPRVPPWFRRGVIFILLAVAALQVAEWLFYNLRSFLGLLFLAWLFSITVEPLVDVGVRRGMRRGLATAIVMFGLAAGSVAFLVVFGALLVDQLSELVTALPGVVGDVVDWMNRTLGTTFQPQDINDSLQLTPERIQQLAQELTPGVVGILSSLVGLLFQALTLILFAFYMTAQGPQLRETVSRWFPPRQQLVISTVWEIAVVKTGGYVVSRLLLALLSSLLTGAFLWFLGVPYWLPLAIWTGLVSQFIPTVGTYLAIAVPALIALAQQPLDALWVVAFGVVYQQVENYFFAPRITSRTVEIHPAVAFGAVVAGAALFGPLGALVSVPVVAAIEALAQTYGHRYEFVAQDDDAQNDAAQSDAGRGDTAQASTPGAPPVESAGDPEGQAGPTV